ncbi:AAA family ATPase [Eggerthellaceae bacterium zg-997]|nr:AAA family ATPase [Eggerthellaceae bacterium zg-997]
MDAPDNATKALAADILSAAPCSIELPAGTGKTQLITSVTNLAGNFGKKTLILTHTNAGVSVIKDRLRRFGVDPSKYSVFTICAWAERISHAYPLLSEIDIETARSEPDYFTQCILGAVKLCSSDAFGSVILASYSLILIDEYQDCDMVQHRLAIALRDIIGSVAVFGDRLQRIFDFKGQQFPDWALDVESSFTPLGSLEPKPHRWSKANPELGRWLLEYVRPELMAGKHLDFASFDVANVKHILSGSSQEEVIKSAYAMRRRSKSAAVLCPNLPLAFSERLSKRLAGSFELVEEMEGKFARERLASFPSQGSPGEKAKWLAELARDCHSRLSKVLDGPVLRALQKGKSLDRYLSAKARKDFADVLINLGLASREFDKAAFKKVRVSISNRCGSCLVRREAWNDALFAIETFLDTGEDPIPAFERTKANDWHRRYKPTSFKVSRVLLVKGLEFDSVAVVKASDQKAYSKENLYVALTRPTRQLVLFD